MRSFTDRRETRGAFWALELFSAAAGLVGLPLLIASLFVHIDGIWWFAGIWVAVEVLLFLIRPHFMKRTDSYKPPQGRVP